MGEPAGPGELPPRLLDASYDNELQSIVERAAHTLRAPIALVTLVLDQIQYFKAHYGLPPELAAARGTACDVSFCQFVVREGRPFEVSDAPNDTRIPQHLVEEYDIRAYLGVPIACGGAVLGSLCVIDTEPRTFDEDEYAELRCLAARVSARLDDLKERRRSVGAALTTEISGPALAELRRAFVPLRESVEACYPAMPALRSFLGLADWIAQGQSVSPRVLQRNLRAALRALEVCEEAIVDVDATLGDCEDHVEALENLVTPAPATPISTVLEAAQDLARAAIRPIGGAPLPDLRYNPRIAAPRPFAVALLTTSLSLLARHLAALQSHAGIRMSLRGVGGCVELALSSPDLTSDTVEQLAAHLDQRVGRDPTVAIKAGGGALWLAFAVVGRSA